MSKVLLKTYKGTPINVDTETGRFTAMIPKRGPGSWPEQVTTKDLVEIERLITQSIPTTTDWAGVDVMSLPGNVDRLGAHDLPDDVEPFRIVSVRTTTVGRGKNAQTETEMLRADGEPVRYYSRLYLRDEAAIEKVKALAERKNQLVEEYKQVLLSLTPIERDRIIAEAEQSGRATRA